MNQRFPWEKLRWGIQAVALFEAFKGLVVLIGGIQLLEFLHGDISGTASRLMVRMGIDTHTEYPQMILQHLAVVKEQDIVMFSGIAILYATLRFAEAYGLWRYRNWARWLGIVSGALYLPFELYHLYLGFSWLKLTITALNVLLVIYLLKIHMVKQIPVSPKII
ncbi:hypothetical protein D3C87_339990 [compost metagenome]